MGERGPAVPDDHVTEDPRRWVAFRAYGLSRFLLDVQGSVDDALGAARAGQLAVVALAGRRALLICLSIRSLRVSGELLLQPDLLTFDPFRGLCEAEVAEAAVLMDRGADLANDAAALEWVRQLVDYAGRTAALLDDQDAVRNIRSPEGMFPAIRMARTWVPVLAEMGLPSLFPPAWVSSSPEETR